jgi:hypothetical protein
MSFSSLDFFGHSSPALTVMSASWLQISFATRVDRMISLFAPDRFIDAMAPDRRMHLGPDAEVGPRDICPPFDLNYLMDDLSGKLVKC